MAERMFLHEAMYRGQTRMGRFEAERITVCGAGALGANLCENLARQGFKMIRVIDRDKVEQHNLSTQPYGERDVGTPKVRALHNRIFRDLKVEIGTRALDLSAGNVEVLLWTRNALVVDCFDNHASRLLVASFCQENSVDCVHLGMSGDGYSEVIWNERYRVPEDANGGNICDYPLARNLVMITVAVATEQIIKFVSDGVKENSTFTLRDFNIRRF